MKIFKNRKFAVLITIIVVVLATLLGVRGSINRLARDVEVMFYDGVYLKDEGYTQPGIESHLQKRLSSAMGLATLMKSRADLENEADALLSAQSALVNAKSIRDKFTANENLQRAFVKLVEKAEKTELSERELDAISQYSTTFLGAQDAIQNSRYNQQARSYMDGASFPVHLIRPFLFARSPQVFA